MNKPAQTEWECEHCGEDHRKKTDHSACINRAMAATRILLNVKTRERKIIVINNYNLKVN